MTYLRGNSQRWAITIVIFLFSLGSASAQFETRSRFVAQPSPYSIAVGDFNRDGKLDVAVATACCPNGGVSILLGNGDGTFQPAVNYSAGVAPTSVVAADFNGDGNLDLAVANSLSKFVSILLGNGDGTFRAASQNVILPAPAIGPVFSDIKQGCEVTNPPPPDVTVCPSGQYGCQLGGESPWSLSPTYDYPQTTALGAWTNNSSCVGFRSLPRLNFKRNKNQNFCEGSENDCRQKPSWLPFRA